MIYSSVREAARQPRLIYVSQKDHPNLIAVSFEFMKRIPASFCVERALHPPANYTLDPSGFFAAVQAPANASVHAATFERAGDKRLFLETSSGNMATGLAEICQQLKIPLLLLVPSEVDETTRKNLVELGARVEVIETMDQAQRVERLAELKQEQESQGWRVCWVQQYTNPNNRSSYWEVAEFLASELDRIDTLVAPVGTGGSSCGTAHYLRKAGFPRLKLVGVDACGSVNFDHEFTEFLMGGLGSTVTMPLVDHTAYDVVHWVDDVTAFAASINLFNQGLSVGGSSGAAFVAARHEASKSPDDVVLVFFPDHGRRYADSIRSDSWRRANNIDLSKAKNQPIPVTHPDQSDPSRPGIDAGWYRIDWRTYQKSKPSVHAR